MIFPLEQDWERAGILSPPLPQPPKVNEYDRGRGIRGNGFLTMCRVSNNHKTLGRTKARFLNLATIPSLSFGEHLMNSYYVPGTVYHTGDPRTSKPQSLPAQSVMKEIGV